MKNSFAYFTLGQLAKIHQLNKRTLHYYDEIGLFSPVYKGENGYRYYSFGQSMELENILALRELGMSIDEIKDYLKHPNAEAFNQIATRKLADIEKSIARLKRLKGALQQKHDALVRCSEIYHGKIELADLPEQSFLLTPLSLRFDSRDCLIGQSAAILEHLREAWSLSGYRKNCGSYFSLEKIQNKTLDSCDGIFTAVDIKRKNLYVRPGGRYLRGFCVGDWEDVQSVYERMLDFADSHNLQMSGYAYESGLNEFAIADDREYVTQIEIFVS